MNWVALRMLTGDRSKYLGIVFGVTFATLLMSQQMSIFVGIMGRTGSQIADVGEADIWVMDSKVRFIDEIPALPDDTLQRVRGVDGVAWAVKLYKGNVRCRLEEGKFRNAILFGLDDATLVGAPPKMLAGSFDDLRIPDAVIVDKAGYEYMWPEDKPAIATEGYKLGKLFEMNDRRAVLVGVCQVSMPFMSTPILYTRYSQATLYVPRERNLLSFVLAKAADGVPPAEVCQRIEAATQANRPGDDDRRLMALTGDQFYWKTIWYFMASTGIPINFGITILLGFVVGVAIAGQTFYLFTLENLRQFGSLKAMGLTNGRILGMILLQAFVAGVIGYCLGLGLSATYFETISKAKVELEGIYLYRQVALLVAGCVTVICVLASLLSARKVLVLEPAIVFRG
ncbi:MAG TPA: ABC transporter permease [Gemmataceae bacterium]|jgi:putative ABC transport system permease protein